MIQDNQIVTRNIRTVVGPSTEVVRDTDDIINVDTTLGPVTLTLQNIKVSGLMLNPRCISINDIGINAAINNITILPSGGDQVNSGVSVTISVNGANAKCAIANQTEWSITGIGVTSSGISGSGTVNRVAKFVTPTAIGDSQIFDNGVSVGIGTLTPDPTAIFDITSTDKGFLYPRMTTAQRNLIVAPATSLTIFNTTANRFEYYDGVTWTAIGTDVTLYNGDGTVGAGRVVTLTDNISILGTVSGVDVSFGIGIDPLGFGYDGIQNYMFSTPAANLEGWGGLLNVAGNPTWFHEVYNVANDTSGFWAGWSALQNNSYSSLYHLQAGSGLYTGFEANKSGEQLYSQRLGLVVSALTAADRVLFVSSAGGYIKATTYADLVTRLAIPTLYSANGTVGAGRVASLTANMNWIVSVGNGIGIGSSAFAPLATYDIRANDTRGIRFQGVNATAGVIAVEIRSTSSAIATFYNNSDVTLSPVAISKVNIGVNVGTAKLTIEGSGSTSATVNTEWKNAGLITLNKITDEGVVTHTPSSSFITGDKSYGHSTFYVWGGTPGSTNHIIGIDASVSGGYGAQTTTPIRGYFYGINTNTGIGVQGRAYLDNAAMGASGIEGNVAGNAWNKAIGVHGYCSMFGAGGSDVHGGLFEVYTTVDSAYTYYGSKNIAARSSAGNGEFVGGHFEAFNGSINTAIRVPSGKGNIGFGTITPSNQALLELASTTQAFLIMRMTATEASAITPANGMMLYVTNTDATFLVVGFWGYENGVWVKL